jgi:arabinofuranosyltransferase
VDGIAARQLGRLGPGLLWWRADRELPRYASVALRPDVPFHSGYVAGNLGITGIVAGTQVHIVDPSGLADPIAARLRLRVRGRPGHEKQLNLAWIVARFADPRVSIPEGTSAPAVETARRALSCGRLPEVEAAATRRLTIARFLHNIGVSWRLRSFRLDPDPAVATAQLCGRRSPRGTVGMDGGTGVPPADHPPTGGRRHRRPVAR